MMASGKFVTFLTTHGKIILLVLNTTFMILAFIIMVVGSILFFNPGIYLKHIFDHVNEIVKFKVPENFDDLEHVPVLDKVGLIIFTVGFILFLITFLACCGALCHSNILLILYLIFLVPLTLLLLILGCLVLNKNSNLHEQARKGLAQEIRYHYSGPFATDLFCLSINILSYALHCCGASGPDDFKQQTNADWKMYNRSGVIIHIDIPPACCKEGILENDVTLQCAKSTPAGYDENITNTQGCYDKMQDILAEHNTEAAIVLALMLFIMLLLVAFSLGIILDTGSSESVTVVEFPARRNVV